MCELKSKHVAEQQRSWKGGDRQFLRRFVRPWCYLRRGKISPDTDYMQAILSLIWSSAARYPAAPLSFPDRFNHQTKAASRSTLPPHSKSRIGYSITFPLSPGSSICLCTHNGALPFDNNRSWNS